MPDWGRKYLPFDERAARAISETSRLVLGKLAVKHKLRINTVESDEKAPNEAIILTIRFMPGENDVTERVERNKYGKGGLR